MTPSYSTLVLIVAVVMVIPFLTITVVDGGYSMTQHKTSSFGGRRDSSVGADGVETLRKDENFQGSEKTDGYVKYNPKTCNTARDCGDPTNTRYFCVGFSGGNVCKRPATRGKFCSPNPDNEETMVYKWYPPCNTRTRPKLTCTLVRDNPPAWGCLPEPKPKRKKVAKVKPKQSGPAFEFRRPMQSVRSQNRRNPVQAEYDI